MIGDPAVAAIGGAREAIGEPGERRAARKQPEQRREGGAGADGALVRRDQPPRVQILSRLGSQPAVPVPFQDQRDTDPAEAAVRVVKELVVRGQDGSRSTTVAVFLTA